MIGIIITLAAIAAIAVCIYRFSKTAKKVDAEVAENNTTTVSKRRCIGYAKVNFEFEPEEWYHLTLEMPTEGITTHDEFTGVAILKNGCEEAFKFEKDSFKTDIYLGAMENCSTIESVKFDREYLSYPDGDYILTWHQETIVEV